MAVRRAGLPLTAPSVPLFAIAVVLAVLAMLVQYGGIGIPFIASTCSTLSPWPSRS